MNKDSKQPAIVDTPAFREALRKYRRDELYEGDSLFSLIAHIDAHAAAVAAKAVADVAVERDRNELMFVAAYEALGLINEKLGLDPDDGGAEPILDAIEELQAKASAPQQHAQAALSDQWIDSYADDYLSDGHHKDQVRSMVRAIVKVIQQPVAAPSADAYAGAREDSTIWKKRALEAEESCRRVVAALNAENGPTFMGEPAAAPAAPAVQVLDERAAFEIAFLAEGYPQKELRKGVAGAYAEAIAQIGWRFWQARAALMKGQK